MVCSMQIYVAYQIAITLRNIGITNVLWLFERSLTVVETKTKKTIYEMMVHFQNSIHSRPSHWLASEQTANEEKNQFKYRWYLIGSHEIVMIAKQTDCSSHFCDQCDQPADHSIEKKKHSYNDSRQTKGIQMETNWNNFRIVELLTSE